MKNVNMYHNIAGRENSPGPWSLEALCFILSLYSVLSWSPVKCCPRNQTQQPMSIFLFLRLLGFSALDGHVQDGEIKHSSHGYFRDYAAFVGYIPELVRAYVIGIYLAVPAASAE